MTNTGKFAGKEVVQVYFGAPSGKMEKAAKELCGFVKTKVLKPQESQVLSIRFDVKDMASFDEQGVIEKSAYVLEKGVYHIYVGTDVRSAKAIDFTYVLADDRLTEKLHAYCAPERFDRKMRADGSF